MTDLRRESDPELELRLLRRDADAQQAEIRGLGAELTATREAIAALRLDLAGARDRCASNGDTSCALRDRVVTLEASDTTRGRIVTILLGGGGLAGLAALVYTIIVAGGGCV